MTEHGSLPVILQNPLVRVVFIFLAVGPPVGGLTVWVVELAHHFFGPAQIPVLGFDLTIFVAIIFFSYILGAVPAGVAGLALGFLHLKYGWSPWYAAFSCGLVIGVLYACNIFLTRLGGASWIGVLRDLLICVVPTMVCWLIMKRWYGAKELAK